MTLRLVTEDDVVRNCDDLLARTGCTIARFSQARATMQTPGIPDRAVFTWDGRFAWLEYKAPDGKQSAAQRRFQEDCERCGVPYLLVDDAQQLADWLGAHAMVPS